MADRGFPGRRVVVHVSGSVAAYKACEVVSLLRRRGADVRVAMTVAGARFVSPMTFQSLSGHPVATTLWDDDAGAASEGAHHGMAHIGLGAWAQIQVAAPASADLVARLALGLADDAVTAVALACPAPLLLAPAMETAMWRHPATQAHVETLVGRGAVVVGPDPGRLASGHEGEGRMAEPPVIVAAAGRLLGVAAEDLADLEEARGPVPAAAEAVRPPSLGAVTPAPAGQRWLEGRRVVVTSGGTREPIDPVRYIGNRSSGKMGAALAVEALRLGARVTLVTAAPLDGRRPAGLDAVEVHTAAGMLDAVRRALPGAAILLMAAAVADYRPVAAASTKIKKRDENLTLELVPTVDILGALRNDEARRGVVVVGFAAETDSVLDNARSKLETKELDLIVANDVGVPGIGMGSDENAVTILGRDGIAVEVPRAAKTEVARRIFEVLRRIDPAVAGSS
ncbi:MAG TPA: bifunctional phosphopantothenoylcysteine decarboxylase/phosphopantothenate synthase [Candidatus Dormibacteraeota bacterium]|nr:bifunctional phosphopantothenoylcysteine decarboxylase/phosphopantothenate synthase [Candidatus Dormibacteraeota bacterium]